MTAIDHIYKLLQLVGQILMYVQSFFRLLLNCNTFFILNEEVLILKQFPRLLFPIVIKNFKRQALNIVLIIKDI